MKNLSISKTELPLETFAGDDVPITAESGLDSVFALVRGEFAALNSLIPRHLTSDVELVAEISRYIVESGGKRLRPLMTLLSTQALGFRANSNAEHQDSNHVALAAIIEFLHTATLLHDDVVDRSALRRGRMTANELWGNAPSVLVGDFLYSRAFQLMVDLGDLDIMRVLSNATNTIAEGEVMQLSHVGNCNLSETDYRKIISCKTALLFEAATHSGALLAHRQSKVEPQHTEAMRRFGLHFGIAYQLIDDYLDYVGNTAELGKQVGDDLAEGKLTLPIIHALRTASASDIRVVTEAIDSRSSEHFTDVIRVVKESGALDHTRNAAVEEINLALACLEPIPSSPYKSAMQHVTHFSANRIC